jgi:hypothetical protein
MNIFGKYPIHKAEYIYDNGHIIRYKQLTDDDIKKIFCQINLNNEFAFPEKMVQDFVQDGSIEPTFKKCIYFNKTDLHNMVKHLRKNKKIKKPLPKLNTLKKNKKHNKKTHIKKRK